MSTILPDLPSYLELLRTESELHIVDEEVDPYLEIAEIHRRVIARQGPALLFTKVKGSRFPVVTNLFGSNRRLELAFGRRPQKFVSGLVAMAESLGPPSLGKLWSQRGLLRQAIDIGSKYVKNAPILDQCQSPPKLTELPLLTSWITDGGAFVTLPLVYTEHPDGRGHNLGMYRIQRYDDQTTGIHWQIHKGGGYHFHEAEKKKRATSCHPVYRRPPSLDDGGHRAVAGKYP